MKVLFLLPGSGHNPIGGFKVVYEYADGLAGRGHDVTVAHIAYLSLKSDSLWTKIRGHFLFHTKQLVLNNWKPTSWFSFKNKVRLTWIPALYPLFLPKADAYVATWWKTAEFLAAWRGLKGERLYLIQHFEVWGGPEVAVRATWRAPLKKIVIAKWLRDIAHEEGLDAWYIPNGLDFDKFGIDVPIRNRSPFCVAMLFHNYDWKGTGDGLGALKIVNAMFPTLKVALFGIPDKPKDLPDWIIYHQKPTQQKLREIYNQAAIFLAPSWVEGWPLPPSEAMTCGAAVVATDIGGHREFCLEGQTALLAPAKSPEALAKKIIHLMEDNKLRIQIAEQGNKFIQKFTWDKALDAFENVLEAQVNLPDKSCEVSVGQ